MAHPTPAALDQLAAEAAAGVAATIAEQASAVDYGDQTILAYGATGECVSRLVNLLASAGHATNSVIKGGPPVLNMGVLEDVETYQAEAGVSEPAEQTFTVGETVHVVKGQLVGPATWASLYEKAEALAAPPQAAPAPAGG